MSTPGSNPPAALLTGGRIRLGGLAAIGERQPQAIGDEGCEGTAFSGRPAFGAGKQFLRQSDGRSLLHMSEHMEDMTICQDDALARY